MFRAFLFGPPHIHTWVSSHVLYISRLDCVLFSSARYEIYLPHLVLRENFKRFVLMRGNCRGSDRVMLIRLFPLKLVFSLTLLM